ncbi:cytochrome C assembly protein [Melaminivora suipulveris]|uniref:Cytochrome C assembly protein n=1 Tax=Melaminivora suipulveris TaxID=2109913 RepID=A0A2R3QDP5_9BURK|nr:cytochrome c biogenesis protein CcsA [Melaminivora suipulveris]AVO49892.1 cytochrome C assembly protein [Melaminivora suipulveris]
MILPGAPVTGWLLAASAALAYALGAAAAARLGDGRGLWAMLPAWVLHAAALAHGLMGAAPHFGFAPALSMTAWLVLTTYAVEHQLFPQMRARAALGALGAVAVLLAALFPGRALHVSASPWLALHLTLGIACYGLFAAAVIHAWLMGRAERQMRQATESSVSLPLLTLERLTFRFVGAGFILLSATLVAGWLFGEVLYGRAWRWDHKAVFSLLAWLTFAVLLLGRARFGWRGRRAVRVLYAGAGLLLLAYAGSRFVMEVVLERAG